MSISKRTFLAILLFLTSLFIFIYIADENVLEKEIAFDTRVMAFVAAHTTALLKQIMLIITFFGSSQFLLPIYILLVLFFIIKKNKAYAVDIAIVAISSTAIMYLLKQLFKRHRPLLPVFETTDGYSFPSGHTFSSFIFCSILAYLIWTSSAKLVWKYVAIVSLFLSSVTIGLSRIILNVHFATDVIAAFCLGIVCILLAFWVIKKLRKKNQAYHNLIDV